MARTFRLRICGNANDYLMRAKAAAAKYGVTFVGDNRHGVFRKEANVPILGRMILLDGKYDSDGSSVVVTVHRIPPGYSMDNVEAMLKGLFEGA